MSSQESERLATEYLGFADNTYLVMGVANKKSVAYRIAKQIEQLGGRVIYAVRSEQRKESLAKLLRDREIMVCDVEKSEEIESLAVSLRERDVRLAGYVHSIAFADYPNGIRPFHETTRQQILQAFDISCFSLTHVCNALKDLFTENASVVTIGISTTRMASESYGFMAPIKAVQDPGIPT